MAKGGLMLAMKPSGAKSSVQRIVVKGKATDGSWQLREPTVAEARDAAFANHKNHRHDPSGPTIERGGSSVRGCRSLEDEHSVDVWMYNQWTVTSSLSTWD